MYMYKFNFIFLVEPPCDFMRVAEQQMLHFGKMGTYRTCQYILLGKVQVHPVDMNFPLPSPREFVAIVSKGFRNY